MGARPARIVGIGASAGGLESLERLFDGLGEDTGMAFIVVQHLSPDFRSMMDELIQRRTDMPVRMAEDGTPIEADRVYVMPPAKEMIVRGGQLVLTDRVGHGFTLPIDTFFRSLAQDAGERAIAVVLSGSGSDGSRGVVEVKRAGGLVLAESIESARFDGMPGSAHATGVVDQVLPPHQIARVLRDLAPLDSDAVIPDAVDLSPTSEVLALLHEKYGIDFSLYKKSTVSRRIQRRIDLGRISSIASYLEQLRERPDELDALYRDLLIGVTQFFRDPEAFEAIQREVIPRLLDAVPASEELRVWVAGCATGEEVYSLAMLLVEALVDRKRPLHLKILATDVHERSLAIAANGVYTVEQVANVPPERLGRFFLWRSTGYQVTRELRQLVVFARHDVTRDAPFTKMHLVSCRNMLIYLEAAAYRTALSLFHFALVPNGFLFLGASETPQPLGDEFDAVDDRWKIFRKRRDAVLPTAVRRPLVPRRAPAVRDAGPSRVTLEDYDQLLDLFMPPGFLIAEDRTLIDSFGGAERLLHAPARRPSTNILELIDEDLRIVLGSALQRVFAEDAQVSYGGARIDLDGPARCTVVARALGRTSKRPPTAVVTFQDIVRDDGAQAADPDAPMSMREAELEHVEGLETDLANARMMLGVASDDLTRINADLQATNEELVASNEELQSTNEELHSVNEELQSLNEQLFAANAENQRQIVELREMTDDIEHLLEGSEVGTMFLDRELRIRRFTSRIAAVFRFKGDDVGRAITDFTHTLLRPQLYDELATALARGTPVIETVDDSDGKRFLLRIAPYRSDRVGEGVILTLTDLTALRSLTA